MPNDKQRLARLLTLLDKFSDTIDYDKYRFAAVVVGNMEDWDTLSDYVTNEFEDEDYEEED